MFNMPIEMIVGKSLDDMSYQPLRPYSNEAIEFLSDLSKALLAMPEAREYPDIAAFGFWCRRAQLLKLSEGFDDCRDRIGRGLVFHITPSNVPVNFAFSLAFGLLAGNANIIRISELYHMQARVICHEISRLLGKEVHKGISKMIRIIKYPRNDEITAEISKTCNARILWGGDSTISHLRSMATKPRCIDISFSDRYSICILGAEAILAADDLILKNLATSFYNDVYLLDQNACSSPHLVIWQGGEHEIEKAMIKFWGEIEAYLLSKSEPPINHASEKFNHLCRLALKLDLGAKAIRHGNLIYRVHLNRIPSGIEKFRGSYGFFFEAVDNEFHQLKLVVNERFQTVTYFGIEAKKIINMIKNERLTGLDRVVPIGKALDIGVIWDGYDLIGALSRIISEQ